MAQTERLVRIKHWLDAGRCPRTRWLATELGVSTATVKRDLLLMRDRMNAPLLFDRECGGWRIDANAQLPGARYELPGMWFGADEIHALLAMQQLLSNLDAGGLLAAHIAPLTGKLQELLGVGVGRQARAEAARRVRIATLAARRMNLPHFQAIGTAVLRRKRLLMGYRARSRGEDTEREVSPQRLMHYRDNWYLDAWCHLRNGLRSFSVDAVQRVRLLETHALEMPEAELDTVLGAGYGIFAGSAVRWAMLRFSPERAKWVAAERWHAEQQGTWDNQGRWVLKLPYADPRELVMDILRHVPEVEVLAPEELRENVRARLQAGLEVV